MIVEANQDVVRSLNGLLTIELRAVNQYFLDSKLASHWGLEHLAQELRDASFAEMRDAEALMDRILLLGGLPNLQRVEAFTTGETVVEQLNAARDLETRAIAQQKATIAQADAAGDQGTATMLRGMIIEEEEQLGWIETQLDLVDRVGEAQYLAQQIRS